ncbi:MAG: DinB family protein [Bacteroidota bacterium]
MPIFSTHLLLNQLQHQTEQHLQLAISNWQMISHTRFSKKPTTASWSANECLQHLNSYGNYYLPAIEKAISAAQQTSPSNVFRTGWLGNYFTNLMKPGSENKPLKKMKAPKDHSPVSISESHTVISTFIDQQEKILQLLEQAKLVNLESVRIPVSISKIIRLKLGDTFNFLVMHNTRHVQQAQKALGSTADNSGSYMLLEKALINK